MKKTIRTWTALGAAVTAGAAIASAPPIDIDHQMASAMSTRHLLLAQATDAGGEGGGEGGGALPASYALQSTDPTAFAYDATAEIGAYIALVEASYDRAYSAATEMQTAIAALLATPTPETLAAARAAWVAARPAYIRTEAFRFYDGPIEDIEGRINAWPLNEAYIDYVNGAPDAGIINDPTRPINLDTINQFDQSADEADITTGWHAVEFLLWGQDLSLDGPGARPVDDYVPGVANNDRRRDYLRLVTDQLVGDLKTLSDAWTLQDPQSYAAKFAATEPREAIGRIFNGMAVLAGFEFMSERLAVGLDSGDQEDEHSCFSDTTHQDFVADFDGIRAVWSGDYAADDRPGFDGLVRRLDPALAAEVDALFVDAGAKVNALGDPWDRVLASDPGSPERTVAEEAVTALQSLAAGLRKAGNRLGVLVLVPGA